MPFPLPFTPFEYYYWSDDRPRYSMTFPVELVFSGHLERETFARALRKTLQRHPQLRACVDDREARPSWVEASESPSWFDWADGDDPIDHPRGETIDLRHESGLRVWARAGNETTRLVMQFHHACCDGLAALQFIEETLVHYAGEASGLSAAVELPPLDEDQLLRRDQFAAASSGKSNARGVGPGAGQTLRHWGAILLRRPAVLAAPNGRSMAIEPTGDDSPPNESASVILPLTIRSLSADETRLLKSVAASREASLNDLLLRDLLATVADWQRQHGESTRRTMWVNVPINLRGREDRRMPATNRISFGFVGLSARECDHRAGALASIRNQMKRARRDQHGLAFLGGLAFACGLKGVVPWSLARERSFATLVLSNLGRVFPRTPLPRQAGRLVCGGATLERVTGAPPVRPLTRAAIAVTEYAERLSFCLRRDAQHLTAMDAATLLSQYIDRLQSTTRRGD